MQVTNKYITHSASQSWGSEVYIIQKDGHSMVRVYAYFDQEDIIYIDSLHVEEPYRNRKMATELLDICENICAEQGIKTAVLWTRKDSWMQEWYKRRGYIDDVDCNIEENSIWMRKSLQILNVNEQSPLQKITNLFKKLFYESKKINRRASKA